MEFIETEIQGVILIKPKVFGDQRGYFFESFRGDEFRSKAGDYSFVQDNESMSKANVLRGLHFQKPPYAQGKLVRVVKGSVLDVAVDIRTNSDSYGKHVIFELNEENKHMLWVPPGFAHGFLTMENQTIFQYKCTNYYNKESEGAVAWNDPVLNIDWQATNPEISEKDAAAGSFKEFSSPF